MREKNLDNLEFSCDTQELATFVLDALADHKPEHYKQHVLVLPQGGQVNALAPPAGYEIAAIDTLFAERLVHIENRDVLLNDITKTWGGMPQFLQQGMGFAALQGNEICSFALTHFRYQNTHCVGVETLKPHRRKGLCNHLSSLLCQRIVAQGGHVQWDCNIENIGSNKTAQKLGFVVSRPYAIYWFPVA